ncbi:hypothetical protein MJO28_000106 [Puccinia striiformis f. sp. tritici]|uniref:Uncharacterized protein n=1 Tax=Puccinia striiformis f. sp. tritici TaxID=168172 RepID=A0ACC0EX63_9BASI|nr:hypothetical protein Pst134EB_002341 [Puccinia striiformis f. sp. tritici]KAI7962012.1 hypothetical protein MJO28_000106 [Puccinia striiformis f. sp. tritici]KAI7967839.1 hypothetical protein MJO29_001116 [Puccinia striiformis f. sp. tritici]KAI9625015.1 hypothetical protein H4Q26_016583 [Puccinia striiformis f. sp. tritici PST-130]
MVSKLLITLVLCICFPAAIIGSPGAVEAILGEARLRGGRVLVASDFNGVLVKKAKGVGPDPAYMEYVRSDVLSPLTQTKHTVYVASSKTAPQLQALLGNVPRLGISAEHNMITKAPDSREFYYTTIKSSAWQAKFSKMKIPEGWKVKGDHQFSKIIEFPEGYGRGRAQADLQRELNRVGAVDFEAALDESKNQVMLAHKGRGKGNLVERLLNDKKNRFGYGISFGDKAADVGMHEAMKQKGFAGVIVGPRLQQEAERLGYFHLEGPEEVHAVLQGLARIS